MTHIIPYVITLPQICFKRYYTGQPYTTMSTEHCTTLRGTSHMTEIMDLHIYLNTKVIYPIKC